MYREWTFQEVQELKHLIGLRRKLCAIAKRLGRTRSAVKIKAHKLGLRILLPQKSRDAEVTRLARLGYYDREIAVQLRTSRSNIEAIRRRLGIKAGRYNTGANTDDRGVQFPSQRRRA